MRTMSLFESREWPNKNGEIDVTTKQCKNTAMDAKMQTWLEHESWPGSSELWTGSAGAGGQRECIYTGVIGAVIIIFALRSVTDVVTFGGHSLENSHHGLVNLASLPLYSLVRYVACQVLEGKQMPNGISSVTWYRDPQRACVNPRKRPRRHCRHIAVPRVDCLVEMDIKSVGESRSTIEMDVNHQLFVVIRNFFFPVQEAAHLGQSASFSRMLCTKRLENDIRPLWRQEKYTRL